MWEDARVEHHLPRYFITLLIYTTREMGAVMEEAERKKSTKYSHLEASHHFAPVAVESLTGLGQRRGPFSGI